MLVTKKLINTSQLSMVVSKEQINSTLNYLSLNQSNILLNSNQKDSLYKQIPTTDNPISKLYLRMLKLGVDKIITPIYISNKNKSSLPELLISDHIVFDIASLDISGILSHNKDFNNKIVINITPYIDMNPGELSIKIKEADKIYNTYVKSTLCRTYEQSSGRWLSPQLIRFVVTSYNIIIGNILFDKYNLDGHQLQDINIILSLYMYQLMTSSESVGPSDLYGFDYVGNKSNIDRLFTELFKNETTISLNIQTVYKLLTDVISKKINNFDGMSFMRLMSKLNVNPLVSSILIEYPPYFVHTLLEASSNIKCGMFYMIDKLRIRSELNQFIDGLIKYNFSDSFV